MGDVSGGGIIRAAACAAAAAIIALGPVAAAAAPTDLAQTLLKGCLAEPSAAMTAALASTVGARPDATAVDQRAMAKYDSITIPDARIPGEAMRIDTDVSAFQGWSLPGANTGRLNYVEETIHKAKIEQATGQPIEAETVSRRRACEFDASVTSGRAIFEIYQTLHNHDFGALLTPDRKRVIFFIFEPDAVDIELAIDLGAPLAGVPIGSDSEGPSRLLLSDGGPRFINSVVRGVATVSLTRAALLAGIDKPATIGFGNSMLQPVVQPSEAAQPAAAKPVASP